LDVDRTLIDKDVQHYDHWIQSGYAGAMSYLVRGRDRRADPGLVFPEVKSILCVAVPYSAQPAGNPDPLQGPRYARYLRSTDYHSKIAEDLERVMQEVATRWGDPLSWKVCVDTSAVLERSWAALAGLGWIGKNSMLIHPKYGSYLFLAEVLISEPTGRGPSPLPNYCGNCTRCLDGCPTRAFVAPRVLDSNRCISYLTLEKRGEFAIAEEKRQLTGSWVAGCDICQEVCPFNTKVGRNPLEAEDRAISLKNWRELLLETEESYRLRVKHSSLSRVKPAQFRRNLAHALGNIADQKGALTRPECEELQVLIRLNFERETDEFAKAEWQKCLESWFSYQRTP
jgi:epoxyqueuosine reductase